MIADFSEFWALYPRKVAKKEAEKAWRSLNLENRLAALQALPRHAALWDDKAYVPHAATWLRGERWEDVLEDVKPEPKVLGAWWSTHEGVEKRARELGMVARAGESWPDFKERVVATDKINRTLRIA